jgi:hypothetical protein
VCLTLQYLGAFVLQYDNLSRFIFLFLGHLSLLDCGPFSQKNRSPEYELLWFIHCCIAFTLVTQWVLVELKREWEICTDLCLIFSIQKPFLKKSEWMNECVRHCAQITQECYQNYLMKKIPSFLSLYFQISRENKGMYVCIFHIHPISISSFYIHIFIYT